MDDLSFYNNDFFHSTFDDSENNHSFSAFNLYSTSLEDFDLDLNFGFVNDLSNNLTNIESKIMEKGSKIEKNKKFDQKKFNAEVINFMENFEESKLYKQTQNIFKNYTLQVLLKSYTDVFGLIKKERYLTREYKRSKRAFLFYINSYYDELIHPNLNQFINALNYNTILLRK